MLDLQTAEEKIQSDYYKFMDYIGADSRADQLRVMYQVLNDELVVAPASGKTFFHNAFPGGYLDHVLAVAEAALKMSVLYKNIGGDINFTKEEMIFAALHHDLGKLGTEEGPYYVTQESDWHRKNGEMYIPNQDIQFFRVADRGLMMLQKYGIKITEAEWLAIKLADGLYDEANKGYLINYTPYPIKSNLPYIIAWADAIASRVENDKTRIHS